jgi:hypothetical protein
MDSFDWLSFLQEYSRECLDDEDELLVEDSDHQEQILAEVRASGWLGYPGATEAQIAAAEARIGVPLPSSYRAFLMVSNGWHAAGYQGALWSTEEIEWYAIGQYETVSIWTADAVDSPDETYFDYSADQNPIYLRGEYLRDALQIGPEINGDVDLLIPRVTTTEGEWEAWGFSHKVLTLEQAWEAWHYRGFLPGAHRWRSFREMLTGHTRAPQAHCVQEKLAWPNRSLEEYIASLQHVDLRVRLQSIAALRVLGDRRAVAPLLQVIEDDISERVRGAAVLALSRRFKVSP